MEHFSSKTSGRTLKFPVSSNSWRMLGLMMMMMTTMIGSVQSDIDKDKEECANQLVGLATCLPYVGGKAKAPTIDCCSGLKQVLDKSRKCLCILIKDRDDPSLGLQINATLAATLPSSCHAPTNITECISLLHLAPNSTDAKLFEGFAKISGTSGAPATAAKGNTSGDATKANEKSDGGNGRGRGRGGGGWVVAEMVLWSFIIVYHSYLIY